MLNVLMKVFGRGEKKSGQIAKERLQVVLIRDRAALSPEIMDCLKNDIITVLSKYVEINTNEMEISFENDAESAALIANIPINAMHTARR